MKHGFDPAFIKQLFFWLQFVFLGVAGVWLWLRLRPDQPLKNQYFSHEPLDGSSSVTPPPTQTAKNPSKPTPAVVLLEGFNPNLPPHEILGVRRDATAEEIQAAYRKQMKRYHPDLLAPPGSRAWQDAQSIAEVINRAKAVLLEKRKK